MRGVLLIDVLTPFTEEDLVAEIGEGLEWNVAESLFHAFRDKGMITIDGDVFSIANFSKRNRSNSS